MKHSGAWSFTRLAAFLLTALLLFSVCIPTALAADIWDDLTISILWTDGKGRLQSVPAVPVTSSADRAYWVNLDPAAMNQPLIVDAQHPDKAYNFYLEDDIMGGHTTTLLWTDEMDAAGLGYESAYQLFFSVNGVQADMPILLYLSSTPLSDTGAFEPFPVKVPVYYVAEDGTLLDSDSVECWAGETTPVWASSAATKGYTLLGPESVNVTVDHSGYANPTDVTFLYRRNAEATPVPTEVPTPTPVSQVSVPVAYIHMNGDTLDIKEIFLAPGTHTIYPDSSRVKGYELRSDSAVTITVYPDGSTDLASVAFYYDDPAPAEASIPVYYYHENGSLLDEQQVTLSQGAHKVAPSSKRVSDYELSSAGSVTVTVYADGSHDPAYVQFTYRDKYVAPKEATIPVNYIHIERGLIDTQSITRPVGTHTIYPDSSKVSGLLPVGSTSAQVTVYEDGTFHPGTVDFYYEDAYVAPTQVKVTIHYQDDRGRDVAPAQIRTYEADGNYVIKAAPEGLSGDYELAPGLHSEVTVSIQGGQASQNDVYFYYQLRQAQVQQAVVTIHYLDTDGKEIAKAKSITLAPGVHQLTPDKGYVPAGYELASAPYITVEVYNNGTFSPQEVAFYYREPQVEEKLATVTVYYKDDRGKDVASAQTLQLADGTHIIRPAPENLPAGYEIFEGTETEFSIDVTNGVARQSQVVFYYRKVNAEPTIFSLPVYYYDTQNRPIATTQYVQVAAGSYSIQANPGDLPEGYELAVADKLSVTVHADGSTTPAQIAFYYNPPQTTGTVTVSYVDLQGNAIAAPFTIKLAVGTHSVEPDVSRVPGGYDPASAEAVQVRVNSKGTATPSQIVFAFAKAVRETPIPVGEHVYRYATVNGSDVALRSEPSKKGKDTIIRRLPKGSKVYVMQENYNSGNEVWALVNVDGAYGYMMSKFLDIMTQAQSDAYAAGSTPAPTFTPVPTAAPTRQPTPTPTYEPTQAPIDLFTPPPSLEPLPTEIVTATPTASPVPYTGYALTSRATALRTGISSSDMTIMQSLAANELVTVVNQVADPMTGEVWSIVSTLNGQAGFVQHSALRPITEKEAAPYILFWEQMHKTPEPTQLVTATPEPMQMEGYGVVLGAEVPFRQMASEYSRIIDNLEAGTIVYITGQTPSDGQYWHSVNYEGYWGYIRTDLVRMLTIAEEEAYLDRLNATPEPVTTNLPFDAAGMSSYGYVDCSASSSVNWRESPSTSAKKVGTLRRYAFCLVLGSEYVNGTTWYEVRYGDQTGYLHGDFFKQMTISELEDFLGSDEYLEGVKNNSPSGDSSMDDVGFTGTGGIVSAEDQWVNKNPDVYASFAPFNPIGTVAPIATPTLEPLPGWATSAPTATPTASPTFNPLPDVVYPTVDNGGDGSSALLWAVVIGLLLLAFGGVFALVRHQQNKRRIAMRAAQRRAQAARAQQMQQRPYARTANPGQPRTGAYPNQGGTGMTNQPMGQYAPYSGTSNYPGSGYSRPSANAPDQSASSALGGATQTMQPVGRRTARRAQNNTDQSYNDPPFPT